MSETSILVRPSNESVADFDQLAMQLVHDLKPVRPGAVSLRLIAGLAAGVAASVAVVGIWPGYRPDMPAAARTVMFWEKLGYVLAVGILALWAVERLARPGSRARSRPRSSRATRAASICTCCSISPMCASLAQRYGERSGELLPIRAIFAIPKALRTVDEQLSRSAGRRMG